MKMIATLVIQNPALPNKTKKFKFQTTQEALDATNSLYASLSSEMMNRDIPLMYVELEKEKLTMTPQGKWFGSEEFSDGRIVADLNKEKPEYQSVEKENIGEILKNKLPNWCFEWAGFLN